jgi:peptide/nickel transport system permease protein
LILKLTAAAVAVVGAVLLLLSLTLLIPGDPATMLLGPRATPETVAALKAEMGLDLPLPTRLAQFLGRAATGDLGVDIFSGRPVATMVMEALPNTILLAVSAIVLAILFGIPLGTIAALKPDGIADQAIAFLSVGFVSAPSFVNSIFLLLVFALWLNWFPVLGAGNAGDPLDQLWHVVLPAVALAVGWIGYIARLLRSSLLEVLNEPYVRTMRAYGLPEAVIVLKYALKPACIPTLAILGIGVGELLGGAVFAEVIFNRPGLGSLIYGAIAVRNYPVVQGGVLVVVLLFVATNFLVDLSYLWIDPRARARLKTAGERSA